MQEEAGSSPGVSPSGLDAPAGARLTRAAFWVTLVAFGCCTGWLATESTSPGTPDSISNLIVARNLLAGNGFSGNTVYQLLVPQDPHREMHRTVAVPYLLAALLWMFGYSPALLVLTNGAVIALTALLLRSALRGVLDPRLADLAGVLWLLGHRYQMISAHNNNYLTLCVVLGILLWSRVRAGRITILAAAVATSLLMVPVALLKVTYLASLAGFGVALAATHVDSSRSHRAQAALLVIAAAAAVFGSQFLFDTDHLAINNSNVVTCKYHLGNGSLSENVRIPALGAPLTHLDALERLGTAEFTRRTLDTVVPVVRLVYRSNPFLVLLLAVGLTFLRRETAAGLITLAALTASPLTEGVLTHLEVRYLWPVFPVLLAMTALTLAGLPAWATSDASPALRRRGSLAIIVLLALALALGARDFARGVQADRASAILPVPEWAAAVAALPEDARTLSHNPVYVAWYGTGVAVNWPLGSHSDLLRLVDHYDIDHALIVDASAAPGDPAFLDSEIEVVQSGAGWSLCRLSRPRKE